MPPRFSSDESSPDAAGQEGSEKTPKEPKSKKSKKEAGKPKQRKPQKTKRDDDDEEPDHEHAHLPGGGRDDEDDDDDQNDFGLDGLSELLSMEEEGSGKPAKKPAASRATRGMKKPSSRKRDDEAKLSLRVWLQHH